MQRIALITTVVATLFSAACENKAYKDSAPFLSASFELVVKPPRDRATASAVEQKLKSLMSNSASWPPDLRDAADGVLREVESQISSFEQADAIGARAAATDGDSPKAKLDAVSLYMAAGNKKLAAAESLGRAIGRFAEARNRVK